MASASWSSATITSTACLSSSITIRLTSAGDSAFITNSAVSDDHSTTSMRSPANSLLTAFTREPRTPIQVPCGSMRWSLALTATFARWPGSRATSRISNKPSAISGTSISYSFARKSPEVRLRITCLRPVLPISSTRKNSARIRSPPRKFSRGIICSRGISASSLPGTTSTMMP